MVVGELRRPVGALAARCRPRPTSPRCWASRRRAAPSDAPAATSSRQASTLARHRQPGRREDLLGPRLVHGQRRGQHAGMGVGDPQPFQQALDAAVLAPAAVQRVERDVGLQSRQSAARGRARRRSRRPRIPLPAAPPRTRARTRATPRARPKGRPSGRRCGLLSCSTCPPQSCPRGLCVGLVGSFFSCSAGLMVADPHDFPL